MAKVRAADAVAPVTVLVGSVLLRPFLSQVLASRSVGALGLQIETLGEFGARLGGPGLVSSERFSLDALSDRALAAVVARRSAGYFEVVRDAAGFADASRRTNRELRLLPDSAADTLSALGAAAESPAKGEALVNLVERTAKARSHSWDLSLIHI